MEIFWSGHSCITLRGKETTLVLDPCPPDIGCARRWGNPEVVIISHMHPGHSYTDGFDSEPRTFCGPGEYEVGGAFIIGHSTYHDSDHGAERGKNTLLLIEMEGLSLCHTGDLGHPLSSALTRELAKVDVLFLPVGGVSTLSIADAVALTKALQPRYVVPMHYRTETSRPDLEPLDTFIKAMGSPQLDTRPRLTVSTTNLPMTMQVVALTCDNRVG